MALELLIGISLTSLMRDDLFMRFASVVRANDVVIEIVILRGAVS